MSPLFEVRPLLTVIICWVLSVAAGLAMLIAQGTTQLTAGDTALANNRTPITVETTTSGPSELTALTSTTALVASSHADHCDSYNDLGSAVVEDAEQETNL